MTNSFAGMLISLHAFWMAFGSIAAGLIQNSSPCLDTHDRSGCGPRQIIAIFFLVHVIYLTCNFFHFCNFCDKDSPRQNTVYISPKVLAKSAISNPASCPQKKFVCALMPLRFLS